MIAAQINPIHISAIEKANPASVFVIRPILYEFFDTGALEYI